ncbi:carboxylesterase family protein [Filimonas effusa]|uniref:Phospholipase n=1 Tax=Filimonas effusa TaxID=2508721 RepID=A0A4Q1DC73_9BACT|nr:hypothetical protein [Filimonas effusa]RXK86203.1 hypothetical protein ESB13_05190 [Filimonas effusa]
MSLTETVTLYSIFKANTSYALLGIVLTILAACTTPDRAVSYQKLAAPANKEAAYAIRAGINKISNDSFTAYIYTGKVNDTVRYRALKPLKENAARKFPLVLILPTSGGIGTDNTSQLNALVKMWAQPALRSAYPAYVVAPQFSQRSSNYTMNRQKGILVSIPSVCLANALDLVDSLCNVWPVDKSRIYVMGFSMGASATINVLGLRPDLFTAGIAISGIPDFDYIHPLLNKPIWFVHGNADDENPFATDSVMLHTLREMHATHKRFWEIDKLAHEVYPPLYTTNLIPEWLFKQRSN